MARGAESTAAAGKHNDPLLATVWTADAGKPAARVAAVQIALDDFFDDGPEGAVLLLEARRILGQEAVEVMKDHPVEDGPLGITGAINPCHSKESSIKKRANPLRKKLLTDKIEFSIAASSAHNSSAS